MAQPRRNHPFSMTAVAFSIALATSATSAFAFDESVDALLETLKAKGALTEEEYTQMKSERDEQRKEVRAERRKQALRDAVTLEKEEKQQEAAKSTLTGRFRDGFSFESGDKKNSIALTGRVHGDYRAYNVTSSGSTTADTFDLRRAYIGLSGRIAQDFTFDVTADVSQSGTALDVAWANWEIHPAFQFRMGQFKMPMSIEELTSSRFIDFQERSLVNGQVPAKERGLMFHGSPYKGVFYGLALSNGAGKNNNESLAAVDGKDVIGRLGLNVAELIDRKDMVLHGAVAISDGEIPGASNLISLRTEGRGLTYFQQSFTANSTVERRRTHLEASLAFGPVKLQGERIVVNYNGANSGTPIDADLEASYVEALWMITGENYAEAYRGGAYGAIKPLKPYASGSGNPGAWEVGVRMSQVDASEFPTPSSGLTREADAVTVGLKWIPVTNVRFYLNFVHTKFDRPVTVASGTTNVEKAVMFRTGLYF